MFILGIYVVIMAFSPTIIIAYRIVNAILIMKTLRDKTKYVKSMYNVP